MEEEAAWDGNGEVEKTVGTDPGGVFGLVNWGVWLFMGIFGASCWDELSGVVVGTLPESLSPSVDP
jgi:hypothetical protein